MTAAQSRQAHRIAQGVQHSLQVPVYDATQRPDGQFAGVPIGWIPIEEAIRQHRAELTALLAAPRPDAIAAQQVAREIAVQELILKETVAAGLTALETILTPEQRAQLMPCPLQNGLPG